MPTECERNGGSFINTLHIGLFFRMEEIIKLQGMNVREGRTQEIMKRLQLRFILDTIVLNISYHS